MKEDEAQTPLDDFDTASDLPPLADSDELGGGIQINNEVVAQIVVAAAKEIPGVVSLVSDKNIGSFFGGASKERSAGAIVRQDEDDRYHIDISLILEFGVKLNQVADDVRLAVKEQVENMTGNKVATVAAKVVGVRHPSDLKKSAEAPEEI